MEIAVGFNSLTTTTHPPNINFPSSGQHVTTWLSAHKVSVAWVGGTGPQDPMARDTSHPYKTLKLPYYSYHETIRIMPLCEHTGQAHNYTCHSVLEGKKCHFLAEQTAKIGLKKFPKILKPSQNSKHQMSDMKKILYQASTNIRCHCTKFSHLCKRTPEISVRVQQYERRMYMHRHTYTFVHIRRVIQDFYNCSMSSLGSRPLRYILQIMFISQTTLFTYKNVQKNKRNTYCTYIKFLLLNLKQMFKVTPFNPVHILVGL